MKQYSFTAEEREQAAIQARLRKGLDPAGYVSHEERRRRNKLKAEAAIEARRTRWLWSFSKAMVRKEELRKYKAAKAMERYRAENPLVEERRAFTPIARRQASEQRKINNRSANWLYRSLQVPGNLDPRKCKICSRYFNHPSKVDWKCAGCKKKAALRNPEAFRDRKKRSRHNRRVRERAGGKMWPHTWTMILKALGDKCLKCGAGDVTLDHIVPLSLGGTNRPWNIQPLCHLCNSIKGDTIADYRDQAFAAQMRIAELAAS